jgi:hypothetical protein
MGNFFCIKGISCVDSTTFSATGGINLMSWASEVSVYAIMFLLFMLIELKSWELEIN